MDERKFTLSSLSNGLRLLHIPAPESPSVFVALTGNVGRRAEEDNEVGAAHFLEHLFFDGTPKHPSAFEIGKFVDDLGAIRNGQTWQDRVSYFIKILAEHQESAFDFVSDIFMNSLLAEIKLERQTIALEAASRRDDPIQMLNRIAYATLYPGQRIGRTIFDDEQNLENMNPDVLRVYMERTYIAENFILTVAGNSTHDQAVNLGEKYFSAIRNGQVVEFPPAKITPEKTIQIDHQELAQSQLALSFDAYPLNHPESDAAAVMSAIFCNGASSRLFDLLRNQLHLVYSVSGGLNSFSDTGYYRIRTLMNEENLQAALDEIIGAINNFVQAGVTADELQKGKNMLLSRLLFNAENIQYIGDNYTVQQLLSGRIRSIQEQSEAIRNVTVEDVARVAKQIFSDEPKVNVLTKTLTELSVPPVVT